MGANREGFSDSSSRILRVLLSRAGISYERSFFDASMDSRFLESFNRCGLSVAKARFSAALGERPASAAASLHQQKFNRTAADAVADRGYLLTFAHLAQLR